MCCLIDCSFELFLVIVNFPNDDFSTLTALSASLPHYDHAEGQQISLPAWSSNLESKNLLISSNFFRILDTISHRLVLVHRLWLIRSPEINFKVIFVNYWFNACIVLLFLSQTSAYRANSSISWSFFYSWMYIWLLASSSWTTNPFSLTTSALYLYSSACNSLLRIFMALALSLSSSQSLILSFSFLSKSATLFFPLSASFWYSWFESTNKLASFFISLSSASDELYRSLSKCSF